DDRTAHPEGQHVVVRGQDAVAGDDGVDAIPTGPERGDAAAEFHGDAEPVPAQRPQALREEARVAARVAEIADRSGDLGLDRFEDGVELRHLARVEDLLLLAVLGEEGHLLYP